MPKNNPLFSIIIPVYGRHDLAKQAIRSVLEQRGVQKSSVEIIVSDDENDRKTKEANKHFFKNLDNKVRYVENVNDEGPGGNRQTGLRSARGKYIVFLDSDDRLAPIFLKELVKVLEHDTRKVAAVCLSKSIFESRFNLFEKIKLVPLIFIRDTGLLCGYLFNDKNLFPQSFYLCQISYMMFRKDKVKDHKFSYDYRHGGEDWDFFVQTLKKGDIRVVPQKLLLFRYSPGSSTDDPVNRQRKWRSYSLLVKRLPERFKKGLFHDLLLQYIKLYGGKYAGK